MVGMWMRENDLVDFRDACLLQLSPQFILLVDITRIDEHRLLRCLHEDAVPLPHVEHLDSHLPTGQSWLLTGHGRGRGCTAAVHGRTGLSAATSQKGRRQQEQADKHANSFTQNCHLNQRF